MRVEMDAAVFEPLPGFPGGVFTRHRDEVTLLRAFTQVSSARRLRERGRLSISRA